MKKIITAAVLLSMAFGANANDETSSYTSYSLALDSYKETHTFLVTSTNETILRDTATMGGIKGMISVNPTDSVQFNFKGRYAIGNPHFSKSTTWGVLGSYIIKDQDRSVWELGAEYRQGYEDISDVHLGVGFNYRERTEGLTIPGVGILNRVNSLLYTTVSMDKEFKTGTWRITPKLGAEFVMNGYQDTYFDPKYKLTRKQNKGNGYNFEINFKKEFKNNHFSISPYFRTMTVEDSNGDMVSFDGYSAYYYEPKNRTTEAGLTVGLTF